MILVGVLLVTGWWDWLTSWLQTQFVEAGLGSQRCERGRRARDEMSA